MRRSSRWVLAAALSGFAVAGLGLLACSSSPKLVGAGGECFQATDCEPGLICAPQKKGPRVCSSDLTGVQSTEPGPGNDAATDGAADAPAPPGDGAVADVASPSDSGPPPVDSGPPPSDAGGG